ncbi:hypothetical protein G3I60_05265 [Streptomyces sp. SID13666]|uniref:hypothetical protein n=1 Tax=Streptomyces sp. SID13666 TaxID=2706054 RepID=UPI0013C20CEB|nr:hypothetical protein [Streptomyces sp. SID13666]NEA53580.1 hypothetical protein [Streptomyces sp. SID13666]
MTTYGFATKALPHHLDEESDEEKAKREELDSGTAPQGRQTLSSATPTSPTPPTPPEPLPDAATPGTQKPPTDDAAAEPPPADDARPWAGDAYDEGDETDPAQAFAAYSGDTGEEAWLDQASDGTLTGWIRDSDGQVWRYADADAWAIDVDDAHMTRTRGEDSVDAQNPDTSADPPGNDVPDTMNLTSQ